MAKTKKKLNAKKNTTKSVAKKTAAKKSAAKKGAAKKTATKKSVAKKSLAPKSGAKLKSEKKTSKPTQTKPKLTLVKSSKVVGLLTPLEDRILVERLEASDRTPGGLFIPDMAQERPSKGKVVAVGHGRRDKKGRVRPLDVKVGDLVLFTQWAGGEIQLDGSTFLIMRESDVLGVTN